MSNGVKIFVWSVLAALGLVGIYAGIGVKKLMNICYNIVKYDLKFDIQYLTLGLTLQVKNPSFLAVDLYSYDLDVFLNNKKVASVASKKYINLMAGQFTQISIPIKVKYTDTFGIVGSKEIFNYFISQRFDKIFVTLKGAFEGKIMKISASVPVDYKITLKEIADIMDSPSDPCE